MQMLGECDTERAKCIAGSLSTFSLGNEKENIAKCNIAGRPNTSRVRLVRDITSISTRERWSLSRFALQLNFFPRIERQHKLRLFKALYEGEHRCRRGGKGEEK